MTTPNSAAPLLNPRRGEVWLVDLTGGGGVEIDKTRPAVVVSSDNLKGGLPLKLIVPITEWKEHYRQQVWHVQVLPSAMNGLSLSSSADAKQVRSVNLLRFKQKLGALRATEVQDVVSAIAIVLEYK